MRRNLGIIKGRGDHLFPEGWLIEVVEYRFEVLDLARYSCPLAEATRVWNEEQAAQLLLSVGDRSQKSEVLREPSRSSMFQNGRGLASGNHYEGATLAGLIEGEVMG
jgi:hypothetical protein